MGGVRTAVLMGEAGAGLVMIIGDDDTPGVERVMGTVAPPLRLIVARLRAWLFFAAKICGSVAVVRRGAPVVGVRFPRLSGMGMLLTAEIWSGLGLREGCCRPLT